MNFDSAAFKTLMGRVREIVEEIAAPQASTVDREAKWPEETLRALQDSGLAGLVVPVESGGHGMGLRAVAKVCEELARGCSSSALCFGMHCVATACLAARATTAQRRRWLEPIAAGEHLTTLALSEPGTGAHLYLPQTRMMDSGREYVVRGTKSFVTNGGHADSYIVSTAAGGENSSPGEFSCVAIDADTPGLEWQKPWLGMGMRGNSARAVELRDVRVPRENILGAEGDQLWYIFEVVAPYFIAGMAGTYLIQLIPGSVNRGERLRYLARRRWCHGTFAPSTGL